MVGKTNAGGGAAGATLVITGVVGHSVTASNGSKTYTRTIDSTGKAVIKGLSTGTWTLTMTGDGQTATRTVDVNADYAVTIAYFSATINVTYPAGSTCKATHTDGTVLNAPDTSGTWALVVGNTGTWTISSTNGSQSDSENVSITNDGQVTSVTLTYFAATISVTYPAGTTKVTCWNKTTGYGVGEYIITDGLAGSRTFTVGEVGTYGVDAFADGKYKAGEVVITASGESKSITLSYWDGTLFDNGNQYSEITGGWIGVSGSNLVSSRGTAWVSNNRISVANFTTIHFNVVGYEFYGNGANGWLGLYDVQNPSDNPVSVSHLVIGSTGEYTIDVSSLTGSYYVRGNVSAWDEYWGTQTVNKIWLT